MARTNPSQAADATASSDSALPGPDLKFEAALAELEQIVQSMEDGGLPLEESLDAYRRGTQLLKHCQQQLTVAERTIEVLEKGSLRDFEPGNEDVQ